jgi:hypothetical protein
MLLDITAPLSGDAGWAGTGLLGAVLAWLLFIHLPNKDKLLTASIEKKDEQIDEQRKEFTASLAVMMMNFRQEAAAERAACEKHFSTLADSINSAFKTIGDQVNNHAMRNQQYLELLKKEIDNPTPRKPT